jgi:hypothetical protein
VNATGILKCGIANHDHQLKKSPPSKKRSFAFHADKPT